MYVGYSDIGGMTAVTEFLNAAIHRRNLYDSVGNMSPRGIFLCGSTGCGKTLLANTIGGEAGLPFFDVSATELVGDYSGKSEDRIRKLFERAIQNSPSTLFIDEIDAIGR